MKIDPQIKADLKARLEDDLKERKKKVVVTSAYKMDDNEKKKVIGSFPSLKNARIEYRVDSDILAGYVVQIGSKTMDLSLRGQLQNFKNLIYEIDR